MNETYIWVLIIGTIVGLLLFVILHKEEGVKQKVKVYGRTYNVFTIIYIDGKVFQRWTDATESEEGYLKMKESRLKEATELYNNLMFNK